MFKTFNQRFALVIAFLLFVWPLIVGILTHWTAGGALLYFCSAVFIGACIIAAGWLDID